MTDPRTGSRWILGDKFDEVHPHLESIDALWNKKWKFPCERSLYPFHDGKYEDFAPIFEALIKKGIHDGYSVEYTKEFLPTCERLVKNADKLNEEGKKQEAIDMYLRACAVYRIARFPYINSDVKTAAYEAQKTAYLKAAALFDVPIKDVVIPHTAGTDKDEGKEVPLYVRIPNGASRSKPSPAVILMCGLDGHRPDNTVRSNEFLARGWASVIVDIPGTADCPADRRDPTSADRLWTSILDWMEKEGVFDMKRVMCWGVSAGGHNGIRAAHTHASRLAGAVGQGAGTHHFFSRPWLEKAKDHEYPWTALPALTAKFGYKSESEFLDNAQKDFSLVELGIVNQPSCRLLLVNGTHDGLMPIEDSMLMMEYGSPKEARFFTGLLHMGYPPANASIYPWMEQVMASAT
ncbi:Alpha/Beta hydrolase protein [Neohortaea acidophila]|uniref:Alpha/Beta hydrolase protein n=1 Tax=Neohortaea acidophila TaxID=245834 RepID=A0A6A6PF15_9PEZI|nr:Alpha/Beta hydrolase protein [Neohortaea acidophila]KAF2478525.1 Alpha/Beta hydrolase protein [Neohortaea acidophila]